MTTFTNALHFFPAIRGTTQRSRAGAWVPSAATEYQLVFGGVIAMFAGASLVVLHALSQVRAFQ
jgi:hypothetical protein